MLKAKPQRIARRRPRPTQVDAPVAAGVLIAAGVVLPMAIAPLLNDSAHPAPAATFIQPGQRFTPLPVLDPVIWTIPERSAHLSSLGGQH